MPAAGPGYELRLPRLLRRRLSSLASSARRPRAAFLGDAGSGRGACTINYQQQLANSAAIRADIQRFQWVHHNVYSTCELLGCVEEPVLQNQIREHVIAIEGEGRAALGPREGADARGAAGVCAVCVRVSTLAGRGTRLPRRGSIAALLALQGRRASPAPRAPRAPPGRWIVSVNLIMDNRVSLAGKWLGASASWAAQASRPSRRRGAARGVGATRPLTGCQAWASCWTLKTCSAEVLPRGARPGPACLGGAGLLSLVSLLNSGVQLNLVDAESQPQPREHRVQMQLHLPLCRR